MTGDSFEYAIRKDVRNNAIVREVDRERTREMWRSVTLGTFLVVVLLFSAWQHFELLRHGYRLEQMQKERAAEEEINRHLRLEIETLRAPARIERLATGRLDMIAPGPDDAAVIERVVTPTRRDLLLTHGGASVSSPYLLGHNASNGSQPSFLGTDVGRVVAGPPPPRSVVAQR
jgi:cell division protein FtsL